MVVIYGYSKCSTVKKAIKFLETKEIMFNHIDNVEERLTATQIKDIHEMSNLDIKKFFNTSGIKYRELNLKDKLANMSLTEKYELLASDGMLVKRPIIINNGQVVVGFKVEQVEAII